jgi:hypothetical protein
MPDITTTPLSLVLQAEQRKKRTANLNRQLRYRLSDLWRDRHRGCSFISDDDEGRLMLMLLLRTGTTTESAMESARWVTDERELKALRKAAGKIPWQQIGELLKLTYAERMKHKLWQWMPVDVPPEEVRRRQKQRNKDMACERQRKQRAKNKKLREMISNNTDRRDAIKAILLGSEARPRGFIPPELLVLPGGWTHASALIERAKTVRAFRRPDGRPLRNLRDAIHGTLKQLKADRVIETKTVPGVRGNVLLARLADAGVTANRGVIVTLFPTVGASDAPQSSKP